jgi:hypothetical protein
VVAAITDPSAQRRRVRQSRYIDDGGPSAHDDRPGDSVKAALAAIISAHSSLTFMYSIAFPSITRLLVSSLSTAAGMALRRALYVVSME